MYLSKKSYKEYGKANSIVEQALSSIKTVYAFTAERRIVERYSAILERTSRLGMKQGIAKGLAVGSTGLSFAIWGFLAWYGSHLVMYKGESGGRIYAAGISFVLSGLYVLHPSHALLCFFFFFLINLCLSQLSTCMLIISDF